MDFARVKSRTALLALGGLALAALLAGGCAAPSDSEKARFGTVTGVVTDTQGNPIPGARLTVISPQGFLGDVGPFTTDALGRFAISGVQLSPTQATSLRLAAEKEGFTPSLATRTLASGQSTIDITVGTTATQVTVRLQQAGATTTVTPGSGITVSAPAPSSVPGAPARQGGTFLTFPANSVTTPTVVTVTTLTAATLPAPLPTSRAIQGGLLGAAVITPVDQVFLAPTTVEFPSPVSAALLPLGTTGLPVFKFNQTTGQWDPLSINGVSQVANVRSGGAAGPNASRPVVAFNILGGGTYAVTSSPAGTDAAKLTWTFNTAVAVGPAQVAAAVPGQSNTFRLPNAFNLAFTPAPTDLDYLLLSFGALPSFGGIPIGDLVVVAPEGSSVSVQSFQQTGTVVEGSTSFSFIRTFPVVTVTNIPPAGSVPIPSHLQFHFEGGGTNI